MSNPIPRDRPTAENATLTGNVLYPREFASEDPEAADVERINQFSFYEIGKKLRPLYEFRQDKDELARALMGPLFQARSAIRDLLDGKPVPVTTSKSRAEALLDLLDGAIEGHFYVTDDGKRKFQYPGDSTISGWELDGIRSAAEHFETVFAEEMREAATYFVPRRGIFWTPALVDFADEAFPEEIRGHVPVKTRADWCAAGRCLAFNLLTASGFHAARAVEGILEAYYQLFAGKPGKTERGWNDYIKALEDVRKKGGDPSPSEKTLAELDQMRAFDRNPIMHPRVVLSESDARILFGSAESLIIAMAQEIKSAKASGGVQPDLALVEGGANPAA